MVPGIIGFLIDTVSAQLAGASAYRRFHKSPTISEPVRAAATGLLTAIVAAGLYIPFRVGEWLSGAEDWRVSAFLALCIGICQAILFKGRPSLS